MPLHVFSIKYKTLKISLLTIFSLFLTLNETFAQVFNDDQNPPTLKWRKIETKNFDIIYPDSFESEAQRMANVLNNSIEKISKSLNKDPKKIAVILQNQGTSSNGFVQLAPRRTEFFTTPSQSFDYQDWLNSLSSHELRHLVQFDKLTGAFNYPPLETLALAFFGVTLPSWFYEGDAVVTETVLTPGGRGRIPEWSVVIKTNLLNEKFFSYSKDYLGSYKDFTPGYYQLGFYMNSKLRRDQGPDILDNIYESIKSHPLRPYNLSRAIKKYSGLTTRKLHDSTLSELHSLWSEQVQSAAPISYPALNNRPDKTPENYLLPLAISKDSILLLKESKAHNPAFFILDQYGTSKHVLTIGYQEVPWFSYAKGKIIWDELRFDGRFQKRSFNVINVYDLKTRKAHQLTHRTRLFAPAISPDAKRIAAIEVSLANQISLVELDAVTGAELKRYESPDNAMLQMPAYDPTGRKIIIVGIVKTGKTLFELDRNSGKFRKLMPLKLQEIIRPVYADGQIVFKAHFNGIDNIYRLDSEGHIFQITKAASGAYNPFFDRDNKRILFNNYQLRGYDISCLDWAPTIGRPVNSVKNVGIDYISPIKAQEVDSNIFDTIPKTHFNSKPYRDIQNLFYFHSITGVTGGNTTGFQLLSDNRLNTLSFYAGYQYNSALRKSEYTAGFDYKRYFPIFTLNYINRGGLVNRRQTINNQTVLNPVTWRENEIKLEITVPVTLNQFNTNYSFGFKTGTSFTNRYNIDKPFPNLPEKIWFPMHYQVYFNRNNRRSARDLGPKWGQNLSLTYRHFPFENKLQGEILTFKSLFYFPGLLRNHSFQASFNWQNRSGNYRYYNDITLVNGFSFLNREVPDNTLLLRYRFPLFYPDWELGPLAYIKRIKGGFFSDFADFGRHKSYSPASFGAELRADMNLLRFYLPNFDLGGKLIFLNEKPRQNPIFEFIAVYSF